MRLFLAGLLCFSAVFADDLPDMGDSSDAVLSPQMEKFIGERFMRQISAEENVLADRALNRYIHDLGYQLLSYSSTPDADFHFFFLKNPDINAFAVPGGYIGVNSGLLLSASTEDELASVLAHEIAHVIQRHSVRTLVGASEVGAAEVAAALLLALAVGTNNPDAVAAGVYTLGAGSAQRYLNFTRAHEQEADRLGISMLAQAQFDPKAMAQFFGQLQKERRFYAEQDLAPAFLQSHPVTVDRIAEAQERAASYTDTKPHKAGSARANHFALNRARLLVLTHDAPEQLARQLQQDLDNQHYQDSHAVRYGLALAKLLNHDFVGIPELLAWLQSHGEDRVLYQLLAIDLAAAQKNDVKAFELAAKALADYPADYVLSMRYAELLHQNKQAAKALSIMESIDTHQQQNADYQTLLAQVFQAQGQINKALLAQGKSYFYQNRLTLAIKQLEQAQKRKDKDYYVDAQINTYLDDWRDAWAEQERLEKELK